MLQEIISVGDKIELYRHSNQDMDSTRSKRYLSQVLDFKDKDKAVIAMPIENSRIIPLDLGDKYRLCFFTKLGLYQCHAVVEDRYRMGIIYMVVVRMTSDLEKFQRRQYYRLDCVKQISYYSIPETVPIDKVKLEDSLFGNAIYTEATMIDISGGGCKFNTQELLQKDSRVIIKFSLELAKGITPFQLLGKIIFSCEVPNHQKTYENRVEFLNIKETERESIVRFIFDEERRRRRKVNG